MCSPGKEFPVSCTLPTRLADWPWQQPLLAAQAPHGERQHLLPLRCYQGLAQPRLQLPAQTFSARSKSLPAQDERDKLGVRSCWCCTPASPALAAGPECACGTSRGQEDQNTGTSFLINFWQNCNKKQSFCGCTGSSLQGGKGNTHTHTTAAHG